MPAAVFLRGRASRSISPTGSPRRSFPLRPIRPASCSIPPPSPRCSAGWPRAVPMVRKSSTVRTDCGSATTITVPFRGRRRPRPSLRSMRRSSRERRRWPPPTMWCLPSARPGSTGWPTADGWWPTVTSSLRGVSVASVLPRSRSWRSMPICLPGRWPASRCC